jgi:regulatory protein
MAKEMNRRITALVAQKRNPRRVNVYLDGEFAFGLSRITAAWLQVGQELSADKIATLQSEDLYEVAHQQALKFLSYRIRSEQEVQQNLHDHDIPQEIIADVMDRLRQSGLVDDRNFAQAWVENRVEFRPRGRPLLALELRQKGIATDVIDQSLTHLDEEELAYRAGLKQSRKLQNLERPEFRRKLSGFLARRGFSYDIVSPVVDRIWAECHPQQ